MTDASTSPALPRVRHATPSLPGAGGVPRDPTRRPTGGTDPVRVGDARRPQDAVPLAGGGFGAPQACRGMTVEVTVGRP